ncbi:hypothetical protein K4K60_005443 [Colletotrichum sp. SAR11_57]|nr:hypothetical protein K4K60_005443 [Colletotrichum sp. SAR11_57]
MQGTGSGCRLLTSKFDAPAMSGFEVAGVVLGTIPLVISALEHYKQGISTIRTWRNYNRELRILILSLETERVRFQDVCEKLLVGLVSPCQIESMVEDPFGPAWQEDVIQAKIKARLWRSFSIFEDIVTDMEEATKEMMKKLDLQPDGKIKWQEATFVIREFKRASFVLKRSDHAEQMTTIKDGITSLESLIDRNIKMEPERKLRSQGRLMRLVRELSASVYRALRSSFQCSCAHEVHLGLVSRSVELAQKDEDEDVIQKLAFQLALTYDKIEKTANDEKEPCERVAWEEVRVQALPKATAQTLTSVGRTSKTKMPEILTSRDILFFKRGAELQYEHAFVMKGLQERLEDKQKGNNSAPSSRCPALLALGILLLELNLGRTIESLRIQYETPPPGAPRLMYDSMTAQRLLQERQMDSLNYKSAVQRCIGGEFARPKLDLNDEDFRQEIYEKVVALLQTDLKNATWSYDVGI